MCILREIIGIIQGFTDNGAGCSGWQVSRLQQSLSLSRPKYHNMAIISSGSVDLMGLHFYVQKYSYSSDICSTTTSQIFRTVSLNKRDPDRHRLFPVATLYRPSVYHSSNSRGTLQIINDPVTHVENPSQRTGS